MRMLNDLIKHTRARVNSSSRKFIWNNYKRPKQKLPKRARILYPFQPGGSPVTHFPRSSRHFRDGVRDRPETSAMIPDTSALFRNCPRADDRGNLADNRGIKCQNIVLYCAIISRAHSFRQAKYINATRTTK